MEAKISLSICQLLQMFTDGDLAETEISQKTDNGEHLLQPTVKSQMNALTFCTAYLLKYVQI